MEEEEEGEEEEEERERGGGGGEVEGWRVGGIIVTFVGTAAREVDYNQLWSRSTEK